MKIDVVVPKRYSPPSSERDGIWIHTLHQFTPLFSITLIRILSPIKGNVDQGVTNIFVSNIAKLANAVQGHILYC